tara:strand:- start:532 stop:1401 length:870 start_codon:yes stop_codon:yes gene_type:complete
MGSEHSFILVGGPASGKSNYLGGLWLALEHQDCKLRKDGDPDDIQYIEGISEYLLRGKFAPRSNEEVDNGGRDLTIPLCQADSGNNASANLIIPDIRGEIWKKAVETTELPKQWMERLKVSRGALLFLRVHSPENVIPQDWVTARDILKIDETTEFDANKIPTQVAMCELVRFMEAELASDLEGVRPRVGIVITAWDRLDRDTSKAGPRSYLKKDFPLLFGRLHDVEGIDIEVFATSAVGGDLEADAAFAEKYKNSDHAGYAIQDQKNIKEDLTLPIAWLMEGFNLSDE